MTQYRHYVEYYNGTTWVTLSTVAYGNLDGVYMVAAYPGSLPTPIPAPYTDYQIKFVRIVGGVESTITIANFTINRTCCCDFTITFKEDLGSYTPLCFTELTEINLEGEQVIECLPCVCREDDQQEDYGSMLGTGGKQVVSSEFYTWINKYFQLSHPDCVRILDFYHVTEKIKAYARDHLNPKTKKLWVDQMCHNLLAKGGRFVYNQIKNLEPKSKKSKKAKQNLLTYFKNNLARMNYPYYHSMNYYIGSGTIESAHKFVIHQRMRRPGQRWSRHGANAVIDLRVLRYNNSWNLLFPVLINAA